MYYLLNAVIVLLYVGIPLIGAIDIIASPGLHKNHVGDTVEHVWTTDTAYGNETGTNFDVYKGSVGSFVVLRHTGGGSCFTYVYEAECIVGGMLIGVRRVNMRTDAAGRCSISSVLIPSGPTVTNEDCIQYMYMKPSIPVISGNTLVEEGGELTLTCTADSQSLPPDFRNLSNIQYTWSGARDGTGETISITVTEADHEDVVTCSANDEGANADLASTFSITLDVSSDNLASHDRMGSLLPAVLLAYWWFIQ